MRALPFSQRTLPTAKRALCAALILALLSTVGPARGQIIDIPSTHLPVNHFGGSPSLRMERVAEDYRRMAIPKAERRAAIQYASASHPKRSAKGGSIRPNVGGTDPCDTAGVNGSQAGYPVVSSGQVCVYVLSPPNCPWSVQGASPGVSYSISGNTLIVGAPPDLTQVSQGYTFSAQTSGGGFACFGGEVAISGTVLSQPERNCGRCNDPSSAGGRNASYGKPVDLSDGEDFYNSTDVAFSGPFGLSFTRSYASLTQTQSANGFTTAPASDIGNNWRHNFSQRLDLSQSASVAYYDETDLPYYFNAKPAAGASVYESISGMTLALNSAGTTWTVTAFDHRSWSFNASGLLTSLTDRFGNKQTVTRDTTSGHNNRIASVADPLSRKLCFYYDSSNRITELSWLSSGSCPGSPPGSGTLVKMVYDSGTNCTTGQLCTVTEPDGKTWTYQYTANAGVPNDLSEVDDPQGDPEEINTYLGSIVLTQLSGHCAGAPPCADTGSDLSFTYAGNATGAATITDGQGGSTAVTFDPNTYLLLEVSGPQCHCGGDQTRTYAYDSYERTQTASDDGVNDAPQHTFTYSYGRDAGGNAYPGPTMVVENLTSGGATRTTSYQYYAVGDPRQDLPQITTLPSVDTPANTMTITDTYATSGTLTKRVIKGYVNGKSTTYTWKWTYDSRGRMLTAVGPRTDVTQTTTYKYFADTDSDHSRAGQLNTIADALGHVTTYAGYTNFTSYTPFGDPQSMTDPNAVTTEYVYDPRGRMLTSTLLGVPGDTANLMTTWTYDGAGRLTNVAWPAGNGLAIGYDTSDRLTAAVRVDGGALQHERLSLGYNTIDQPTSLAAQGCSTPAPSCASWSTTWSAAYGYTAATSNLAQITNADSTFKQFGYIDSGALATYNDENHPTGSNYSYGYDVAGRRLSETRKLGTGSVEAQYGYDLHDNVNSVTDENGNVTTYHYDDFDRVAKEISPVQGTTTYTYDPDSDLLTMRDANSATTTYTYDALDRELTEQAVKGSQTLNSAWTYDDATSGHFGIGRLATMSDPSGSTTYTYERRGLVASEAKTIVGNSFSQLYAYDANGNRNSETYPDGKIIGYTYDFADRPFSAQQTGTMSLAQLRARTRHAASSERAVPEAAPGAFVRAPQSSAPAIRMLRTPRGVAASGSAAASRPGISQPSIGLPSSSQNASQSASRIAPPGGVVTYGGSAGRVRPLTSNPEIFVSAASYEPFGPLATLSFGNGAAQTFTYNTRYFPTENKLAAGSTLADYGYGEDAVGNITGLTDNLNAGYNRSFMYDDLNRLTTANSGASLWGTASGNGYTYDAMGNLKTLQLGSGRTDTFSYSGTLPKLTSVLENGASRPVSYDAFGNELGDGKSTFTYSSRELLATDSRFIETYYYNGFRQRVSTQISSNGDYRDTLFDPESHTVSETAQFATGMPSIAYDYIWFGDRPVAQVDSGGTHWTFADHLGTPLNQTSGTPAITWQAEYEPYGNVWTDRVGSTLHQPLRFPGQVSEQFDSGANGLTERDYNNARWYRPTWGRYTQPDFAGIDAGLNLYGYVDDMPTVAVDPSGFSLVSKLFSPNAKLSPQECAEIWKRIQNIKQNIAERIGEKHEDPRRLPPTLPGEKLKPSISRQGHTMVINMAKAQAAAYEAAYFAKCGPPTSGSSCPVRPPQGSAKDPWLFKLRLPFHIPQWPWWLPPIRAPIEVPPVPVPIV